MARMPRLIGKSFSTPKGCHVRYVDLRSDGARVGYDCEGPESGGRGHFPLPEGPGHGNYPSALVKGVREIRLPGSHVSGIGATVGFELAPRKVTCRKRAADTVLACSVHTQDGQVISGDRRRRGRR